MNNKPKVLIVDDRVENLIALENILEDCQADFIRADSGNEALLKSLKNDFALAIVDVQMPEMDGYQLIELMRSTRKNSDLPVLFVSAIHKDDYYKIKGAESGALDFITKPLIPEIIIGKVEILLQLYCKQQEINEKNLVLEANNKELIKKNSELIEFANIFSHDLQEPIRKFISFSGLLSPTLDLPLNSEQRFFLNRMIKAAKDVEKLLDSMIVYSYAQIKDIKKENINIAEVISQILEDLKSKYNNHTYNIIVDDNLPQLLGDHKFTELMFEQILDNAFKYSTINPAPEITIINKSTVENFIISISDNGTIIPEERISKLFLPLYRLYSSEEFDGVGMGLTIADKIAVRQDGKINICSNDNSGTTVDITFPQKVDN